MTAFVQHDALFWSFEIRSDVSAFRHTLNLRKRFKMTKRLISTTIALAGLSILAAGIVKAQDNQNSQSRDIRVVVNGDQIDFDTIGPRQMNGRVIVPLRGVLE